MLIVGAKPGHDGALAVIEDRRLLLSLINTMSDLLEFCEPRGLDGMVVGDAWYRRRDARA